MKFVLKGAFKALVILVAVGALVIGAALAFANSPFFRFPTGGEYPTPRIQEIIWPTIGYPAMVVPGEVLEVEVDLRGEGDTGPQPVEVSEWRAELLPVREELSGLSYPLDHRLSELEPSERWPYLGGEDMDNSVWHVQFEVPAQAPPELYDLSLEAVVSGEPVSDSQPHAVAVTEDDDNDFTFITLSDIHVHELNNSSLLKRQTDKGIAGNGDPVFFKQAIYQVNLIRPDFVLMLGDYIRGQRRPGELESEYQRFYQALLELEVPAFLVPGNHDLFINDIDGARFYEQNIGPLYYSFDVGDCHFTCVDSYQWPEEDRIVMNKLAYMEPRKWQGQVQGAGDELDPSTYSGELAWLEEDLSSHHRAPLKVMAMHHDPYTPDGKAFSWRNHVFYFIFCIASGGGQGREALLDMAARHQVDMVLGGHRHEDDRGAVPWREGEGETTYACQTCVYFAEGGRSEKYPGYRLIQVEEGEITSFTYLDDVHSYPFYDGSVLEGDTDLDNLDRPALWAELREETGEEGLVLSWEVGSYLGEEVRLRGLVAPGPVNGEEEYDVEGGELYQAIPLPGRPGWALLYLETEMEAGVPGEAADSPGEPAKRIIRCQTPK